MPWPGPTRSISSASARLRPTTRRSRSTAAREDDTIRVRSTSGNTGTVTLNGNAGSDLFQLFDGRRSTVDNIAGPVIVDGTDGNVGGNTDTLTIVDTGDTTGDNVLISAVNPPVNCRLRSRRDQRPAGNDVIFRNIDVLNYTGTQAERHRSTAGS